MRAAVTTGCRDVEVASRAAPESPEGHVLVSVDCVSLCGTDAHIWAGDYPSAAPPLVQGHEIAGRVDGALVVVDPARACGRCHACRVGRGNACRRMTVLGVHADGGLSELLVVPGSGVHRAPGLTAEVAALVEPTSIAMRAVERSAASSATYAVVLGAGPIGVLATRALADRGAHVLAVDRVRERAARARAFGAELVHVAGPDFPGREQRVEIEEWTGGDGPHVVIEATGSPGALAAAIDLVAAAGTVVAVGISTGQARLSMSALPYKELDLLGSRNSGGLFPAAIEFAARHQALLAGLVTHRFPLARAREGLALVHDGAPGLGKVLISVGAS
ncbi:zinc-binding dehydrogenase [Pseudonocardia acaciae]|uniref:zinc-binding dehydrogenase n=1 Tax=Pseudonocardia acaciae TaxID=551276 RepID=UPI0014701A4D